MVRNHMSARVAASGLNNLLQYIIANLGMSTNFGFVDIEHLTFPTTMKVDWIRVYQDPDAINIGCDPDDFPTKAYIEESVTQTRACTSTTHARLFIGTLRRTRTPISQHGGTTTSSPSPRAASWVNVERVTLD